MRATVSVSPNVGTWPVIRHEDEREEAASLRQGLQFGEHGCAAHMIEGPDAIDFGEDQIRVGVSE